MTCDGCSKDFEADDLTAVAAGLLQVCAGCFVPPVFEPPFTLDEQESEDDE